MQGKYGPRHEPKNQRSVEIIKSDVDSLLLRRLEALAGQFGENGLAGLIAVLLFLLLFKNK